MAPVIWGLDLGELKWSKFKSSYMWNSEYHLRKTKFVVYQCALIFCVVSESLGTDVLADYIQGQNRVQRETNHKVTVSNNGYIAAASYNIFAGVWIGFIFGAAFFFDLIWPERKEDKGIRVAWKVCGVLSVFFHLGAALALTIITFTRHVGVDAHIAPFNDPQYWWNMYPKHSQVPLSYGHGSRAIAAVVFVWLGWVSVVPSCILLFMSINHNEIYGPKSKHARNRDVSRRSRDLTQSNSESEKPPEPASPESPPSPGLITTRGIADERTNLAAAADESLSAQERAR